MSYRVTPSTSFRHNGDEYGYWSDYYRREGWLGVMHAAFRYGLKLTNFNGGVVGRDSSGRLVLMIFPAS